MKRQNVACDILPQMTDLLLTAEEYRLASNNSAVSKDYFFVLSIALNGAEDNYLMFTTESQDGISSCSNIAYASKVTAGSTLSKAIQKDLEDDFHYGGDFFIELVKPYDQTTNRKGDLITRLLVYIRVDQQFNTESLNTLNMNPHWHDNSGHQLTSQH